MRPSTCQTASWSSAGARPLSNAVSKNTLARPRHQLETRAAPLFFRSSRDHSRSPREREEPMRMSPVPALWRLCVCGRAHPSVVGRNGNRRAFHRPNPITTRRSLAGPDRGPAPVCQRDHQDGPPDHGRLCFGGSRGPCPRAVPWPLSLGTRLRPARSSKGSAHFLPSP